MAWGRVRKTRSKVDEFNWAEERYNYDDKGRLTHYSAPHPNTDVQAAANIVYSYDYDSIGRVTRIHFPHDANSNANNSSHIKYSYDRLTASAQEVTSADAHPLPEAANAHLWVAEKKNHCR